MRLICDSSTEGKSHRINWNNFSISKTKFQILGQQFNVQKLLLMELLRKFCKHVPSMLYSKFLYESCHKFIGSNLQKLIRNVSRNLGKILPRTSIECFREFCRICTIIVKRFFQECLVSKAFSTIASSATLVLCITSELCSRCINSEHDVN